MAPNVTAVFFAANDLNGTPLLTIDDEDSYFRGLKLKLERDGLGGGEITLARRVGFALFDSGAVQPEVFVRFIVHAYSDTIYYPWGFFLNKREQTVVSVDEDGGEVFRFGGPGPKSYLERGILGIGGPGSGWALDLANGVWRWTEAATVGRILDRIIAQDANEDDPALPDLTDTFDADDDSASVPWGDTDISGTEDQYQIPIGTSLLQALWDLDDVVELTSWIDLGTVASPKFELNVIQGTGADKTGSAFGAGVCLLKEGANIVNESLTLEGASLRKASHVVVEGASGVWGEAVRSSFDPGDYVKRVKIEYTRSKNPNILEKAGLRWLRKQDNGEKEITVEILPGASDSAGFYFPAPNRNLWLSNLISVDTSADGTTHTPIDITPAEDQLVTGLELDLGEAGDTADSTKTARSWYVKVYLNKERPSQIAKAPDQKSAASGHTGCCPPPFPAECDPVEDPGDTVISEITSSGWLGSLQTADTDGFSGQWRSVGGSGGTSAPTETVSGVAPGDYRLTLWLGGSEHRYTGKIQVLDSDGGHPPITYDFPVSVRAPGGHGDVTAYTYEWEQPATHDRIRFFHASKMGGWRYQAQILALSEPPPAGAVDCIPTGTGGDHSDAQFDNVPHYNDPRFTNTDQHPITFLSKPDAINNSGGDLEIGDAVVPDLTLEGAVTTTTDPAQSDLPVRIVTSAGADGEQISVATAGYVTQVTLDGTADAGDYLGTSSTAGALESLGTTRTAGAVALVLADDGAGVPVLIWLFDMPDTGGGGGGAPTTADYLVGTAQAGLSGEIVVGTTPGGELGGTWASPTVDTTHSGSAHLPQADYLVGTANAGLSSEIVVGTSPGGELGGTWASPTVDATHSGSAHHNQDHASRHADAGADPLDITTLDGFPGGTSTYLRADGTFATPGGGGSSGTHLVYKSSDEVVNNSAALQDDDALFFAVSANDVWEAWFEIYFDSNATPDIKFAFTFPSGTLWAGPIGETLAGATTAGQAPSVMTSGTTLLTTNGQGIGTLRHMAIKCLYKVGASGGNLKLQWAQNTANASNTTVFAGSHIIAHKLA